MKKQAKILVASLLFAAGVAPALASAGWVGNSAVCILKNGEIQDTWYYGDNNLGWCSGGAFDGAYLGPLSDKFYLSGQCDIWDNGDANWGTNSIMYMWYKIDDGEEQTLTLKWYDFSDHNNHFKSGGVDFSREEIDLSNLAAGEHTLAVRFGMDNVYASESGYNVATFYIFERNSDGAYIINTTEDLNIFTASLNSGDIPGDSPVVLDNDLDYTGKAFTPIGTVEHPYNALFNGNGHSIIGIDIQGSDDYVGVFGYLEEDAVILEMTVQGTVSGNDYVGGLVGYGDGSMISSCSVEMAVSGRNYVGGIAGYANLYISNCINSGTSVTGEDYVGGIAGYSLGWIDGGVSKASVAGYDYVGGILGSMHDGYMQACILDNSSVSGNEHVGAIVGIDEIGSNDNPDDPDYPFDYHLSNNYYLEAMEVYGADGADITAHSGAVRGYVFNEEPGGIGDEPMQEYDLLGITYFDNGLQYGDKYLMGYYVLYDAGKDENGQSNTEIIQSLPTNPISIKLAGRTLYRDGTWNTICLPFTLDSFEGTIFEDASVMFFDYSEFDFSDGTLTLNFDEGQDGIAAGLPYFVRWENGGSNVTDPIFSNVQIDHQYGLSPTPIETTFVDFIGVIDNLTFDEERKDILYLGAEDSEGNNLYYPSPEDGESVTIGAFRSYFELHLSEEQQVRAFQLNFGDEETGISEIHLSNPSNSSNLSEPWYTLDGRRLSGKPTTSGLYISNGHKVIIK